MRDGVAQAFRDAGQVKNLLQTHLPVTNHAFALPIAAPKIAGVGDSWRGFEREQNRVGKDRIDGNARLLRVEKQAFAVQPIGGERYAKLVGFNYQSTHFTGSVMVAALGVCNGSVDAFPMRQVIRAFEPLPVNDRGIGFRFLAEFILKMAFEPMLPETRCIATQALLDKFPDDSSTNTQLTAFRSQCAALLALNPLAQADFIKCFDKWKEQRRTRKLIVNAS